MAYKRSQPQTSTALARRPAGGLQAQAAPAEDRKTLPERMKEATRPAMVQVAPGKWVPYKTDVPPEISLCRWQSNGDGTFSPLPHTERMVRLNKHLAKLLGFGAYWRPLHRLARMGCIELIQVAPRYHLLNIDSWFGHLRRTAEDPDFWERGKGYLEEYHKVIF